jgi:hypothetical protein
MASMECAPSQSASLFGSALLTLAVGFLVPRFDLRDLLLSGSMTLTGLAFPNVERVLFITLMAFPKSPKKSPNAMRKNVSKYGTI